MDYVPSVFAYKPNTKKHVHRQKNERYLRVQHRREKAQQRKAVAEQEEAEAAAAAEALMMMGANESTSESVCVSCTVNQLTQTTLTSHEVGIQVSQVVVRKGTQTDYYKDGSFSALYIKDDDSMTKFYTGLPSWKVFEHVFSIILPHIPKTWSSRSKLQPKDEFLLVLMRLRLNLLHQDIAYRFSISMASVTAIFDTWINVMAERLKFLIKWSPKEVIQESMPQIFRETYPLTRCIIDCSEIFIERPLSFQARAKTYSNYKKHNTAKFLIAISPVGTISFVSRLWGGRASDKCITKQSGFLDLVEPGDTIMADRGFNISEDLRLHGATLQIPSFTRGKSQLSQKEVEFSQRLARVRIHVERVIGLLKNKYTILQGILPVSIISHKNDSQDLSNIDKILLTCAALTNLSPCIVPT